MHTKTKSVQSTVARYKLTVTILLYLLIRMRVKKYTVTHAIPTTTTLDKIGALYLKEVAFKSILFICTLLQHKNYTFYYIYCLVYLQNTNAESFFSDVRQLVVQFLLVTQHVSCVSGHFIHGNSDSRELRK